MLLLLALLLVTDDAGFGDVWVRTEPGIVVHLDGKQAGITTHADLGLRLRNVEVGRHELTVSMPGAGSAKFAVDVEFGRTTELKVPVLALRARRDPARNGGLELRLEPYQPECFATLRGNRYEIANALTRVNDVAPGKQTMAVTCGARCLRSEVDFPAGRIVVVRADLKQNKLVVIEDRPRVVEVAVRESSDGLVHARIPASARRALIASIGSAEVLEARTLAPNKVQVVFRTSSSNETHAILTRLRYADEVVGVTSYQTTEAARRYTTKVVFVVEGVDGGTRPMQ